MNRPKYFNAPEDNPVTQGLRGIRGSNRRLPNGFALVATLSMMILLAILAIGLLCLSTVSLRSARQGSAQAEAWANARMALMIAIGELQKQMGPDQRISANSSILSESTVAHPHWTGAWNSWIAEPLTANNGKPISAHQTIAGISSESSQLHPDYDKENSFRAWLLSLSPEEATNPGAPLSLALNGMPLPDGNANAIRLVGTGSLGESASESDFVSARLMDVSTTSIGSNSTGRYAWWVGDESQKARVMNDSYQSETLTSAEKIFRSQSSASTGTNSIAGLTAINSTQQERLDGLPSLATLDLVPGVEAINDGGTFRTSQKNFHAATLFSRSVLSDVREGGLKRDLNTLLERPIDPNERSDEFMLYKFNVKDAWANNNPSAPTLPEPPPGSGADPRPRRVLPTL